jgi:hypothetical protein
MRAFLAFLAGLWQSGRWWKSPDKVEFYFSDKFSPNAINPAFEPAKSFL